MYLFADTSEDKTQIAVLGKDGKFVDELSFDGKGMQTELLLAKIDLILSSNNLEKKNLLGIIAVAGPGSYTSLRVGLSALNAMAYSLNIPIAVIRAKSTKLQISRAVIRVVSGSFVKPVMPKYKYPAKITVKTRT